MNTQLKTISWIAAIMSIFGVLLNAYKIIWCWPVWCLANMFWLYYTIKTKQHAQSILWIVCTATNIWGWYQWAQ